MTLSNNGLRNLTVYPGVPPQGIYFGAAGNYAFVKMSLGNNLFPIGVWRVADLQYIHYIYQVTESSSCCINIC
jgi:hypothetical protein